MKQKGDRWIWTNNDNVLELRDVIYMRKHWSNTTQSFEGHPLVTVASRDKVLDRIKFSDELTLDIRVQWICDDPEYAVFSSGLPILWHSSTTARIDRWIAPLLSSGIKYRPGLQTALDLVRVILPWLNEADCDDQANTH